MKIMGLLSCNNSKNMQLFSKIGRRPPYYKLGEEPIVGSVNTQQISLQELL
jgi:hypothetical protein